MNEGHIHASLKDRLPEPIIDGDVDPPELAEEELRVELVMWHPWEQVERVLIDGSLASFGIRDAHKYDDMSVDEREYMLEVLLDEGVLPNILEAPKYTFYISGISTIVLAQITRARIGAGFISVTSGDFDQRPVGYVMPNAVKNTKWEGAFRTFAEHAYWLYGEMIQDGVPLEQARNILPRSHANYHIATFTYRAIQNLWNRRRCEASQPPEWHYILEQMKTGIEEVHPPLGEALTWSCEQCGYPYVLPWNEDFNQFPCERDDARPEARADSGNFLYEEDRRWQ